MIRSEFTKIKGIVYTEGGREYRFSSASDLASSILEIDSLCDEVSEIILKGESHEGYSHIKLWTDNKRPHWGCIEVNEDILNRKLIKKLNDIKDIINM